MEYFGTIFVAVIAFVLGYVLGSIKWKRKCNNAYQSGVCDSMDMCKRCDSNRPKEEDYLGELWGESYFNEVNKRIKHRENEAE